jgi:hypothetical protein
MKGLFAVLLIATLASCASSPSTPQKAPIPEPEVNIRQLSNVAEAARYVTGGISVQYRVDVTNVAKEPITLKRIDLQSMGYGAYDLAPTSRPFDVKIAPGQSAFVEMWGAASIETASIVGANGPVTLRGIMQFESAAGAFQSVVVRQVHANGSGD